MSRPALVRGSFVLELGIVLVLLAVAAAFAVPAYKIHVRKLHRAAAKYALLEMGALEERYFNLHGVYSASAADLGYPSSNVPFAIAAGNYAITELRTTGIADKASAGDKAAADVKQTYSITAAAIGAQGEDTPCLTFTVTSTGVQTSTGTPPGTDCWH